MSWKMRKVVK